MNKNILIIIRTILYVFAISFRRFLNLIDGLYSLFAGFCHISAFIYFIWIIQYFFFHRAVTQPMRYITSCILLYIFPYIPFLVANTLEWIVLKLDQYIALNYGEADEIS